MNEDNLGIELISKDGIINALIPIMSELSIDVDAQGKILLTIMNQKVAYDVEKVMNQLEENQTIKFHFTGEPPTQTIDYETAIDIVKRGGVE